MSMPSRQSLFLIVLWGVVAFASPYVFPREEWTLPGRLALGLGLFVAVSCVALLLDRFLPRRR